MFEEAMENVTEVVTENVVENAAPVVETVANTAVEVAKNAEWKLDSKSFGEGFVTGACTVGAVFIIPKVVGLIAGLFKKPKDDGDDDIEPDDGNDTDTTETEE